MGRAGAEVVLAGEVPPAVLDEASLPLAACLETLCRRVERTLREERRELRRWIRRNSSRDLSLEPETADLAHCLRLQRRVRRIARRPFPQARRQVRRLAGLLRGGEFRSLRFLDRSVIARVEPRPPGARGRPTPPFTIWFVPGDPLYAPIMIERHGEGPLGRTFLQVASHGGCWGEARPLIEEAMEEIEVHDLFLVAFTWALENL